MTKRSVFLVGVLMLAVTLSSAVLGAFSSRAASVRASGLQSTSKSFLPLIAKAFQNLVGSGGALYVFPSSGTTTGDANGRYGLAVLCETTDVDSHPCTVEEIEYAWVTRGVKFDNELQAMWIDNSQKSTLHASMSEHLGDIRGGPKFSEWKHSNDSYYEVQACNGWTDGTGSYFGFTVAQQGTDLVKVTCTNTLPVACCK